MGGVTFTIFSGYYLLFLLTATFFLLFLKAFLTSVEKKIDNPLIKKTKKKYNYTSKLDSRFGNISLFAVSFVVFFTTNQPTLANVKVAHLLFVLIFLALAIPNTTLLLSGSRAQNTQNSSLFLVLLVPFYVAVINSQDALSFVLCLEVLSYLIYFIFFEMSFVALQETKKRKLTEMIKHLLYFFWLSFIGTALLILFLMSVLYFVPSFSFDILNMKLKNSSKWILSGLLFTAINIKLGALFFFLFKAELYKLLTPSGVFILSGIFGILYFLVFFFLIKALPFLSYYFKWQTLPTFFFLTTLLMYSKGLDLKNTQLFLGMSSVLTFCFLIIAAF